MPCCTPSSVEQPPDTEEHPFWWLLVGPGLVLAILAVVALLVFVLK